MTAKYNDKDDMIVSEGNFAAISNILEVLIYRKETFDDSVQLLKWCDNQGYYTFDLRFSSLKTHF